MHACICQEDGYTVNNFVLACTVGPWFIWVPRYTMIYAYRLTVLGVGAVFAYLIRHVRINPLNDSRFMAVFIPMAVLVSAFGNLCDLLLYMFIGITAFAFVWGIYIFMGAILLLSVLFIPKVLAAWRHFNNYYYTTCMFIWNLLKFSSSNIL